MTGRIPGGSLLLLTAVSLAALTSPAATELDPGAGLRGASAGSQVQQIGPVSRHAGRAQEDWRSAHTRRLSLSHAGGLRASMEGRGGMVADTVGSEDDSVHVQATLGRQGSEDGVPVRFLEGDVLLRQGDTRLWADYATVYRQREEYLFEGNVLIIDRVDSISANRVLYDGAAKVGYLEGDVIMTDGKVVVASPKADYFTEEKRTVFHDGLTLVDSTTTLEAQSGTYWSEEQVARFSGDVRLETDSTTVWSDSLTYDREAQTTEAEGSVVLRTLARDSEADSVVTAWIFGNWAFSDGPAETRTVRGNVLLFRLQPDTTGMVDTLVVRSDALRSVESDSLDRLVATGTVRMWRSDLAALADSLVFDRGLDRSRRERMHLLGDPLAWFDAYQVTGDTLIATMSEGDIDSLTVVGGVFLAGLDSTLQRIQQVKGRTLVGVFERGGRRILTVGPNAESIYHLKEEDEPNGAVKTSADQIVFRLLGDQIERILVESGVEGTYVPEKLIEEPLRLDGFVWTPDNRPEMAEFLSDPRLAGGLTDSPRRQVPADTTSLDSGSPSSVQMNVSKSGDR